MTNKDYRVVLIILNWNGWKDTIECLESTFKSAYKNFSVILIDNDSKDNSVMKIKEWLEGKSIDQIETNYPEYVFPLVPKPLTYLEIETKNAKLQAFDLDKSYRIIFIKSDSNLGFSAANNMGIDLAVKRLNSKYIFLLNNDTVIAKDALQNAVELLEKDDTIKIIQAAQYYYDNKNKLAHAGGYILFWGQYKYYKNITDDEIKKIKFASGCALCIRTEIIKMYGALSEKYFFGEEDFEYSLRMKKHGVCMVCLGNCKIYHKVAVSAQKMLQNHERSVMLYSLNRIINMKDYYPRIIWKIWRFMAIIYFTSLLIFEYKNSIWRSVKTMYRTYNYSSKINDMKKSTVDTLFQVLEQ